MVMMSKLLLNERPILVLPKLATKIGLNEAMLLQQIHYWATYKKNLRDGFYWVYNSYAGWEEQFPFFSKATIGRALRKLEEMNLVIVGNFNKASFDKTKWYRVNYEELLKYEDEESSLGLIQPLQQKGITDDSNLLHSSPQNESTIPEITSESNSNINNIVSDEPIPYHSKGNQQKKSDQPNKVNHSNDIDTIITYLNDKTGKRYSSKSAGNKRIIQARLNEGYTVDDFKRVIDHKCKEWLPPIKFSNGKMSDTYLRPSTLFNQKFDQYLNEAPKEVKETKEKKVQFGGYGIEF